jgi:hypothetical protein
MAALVRQYHNFPLGAVDAAVVAVAERLAAVRIATLDHRHFRAVTPRRSWRTACTGPQVSTVDCPLWTVSISLSINGCRRPRMPHMTWSRPTFPGRDTQAQGVTDLRIKRLGVRTSG